VKLFDYWLKTAHSTENGFAYDISTQERGGMLTKWSIQVDDSLQMYANQQMENN